MELAVVKHIKEHGLEATLSEFNLKHKDYGHKVIIKYDQINSSFLHEEVKDCRGLILEKYTWKVMSLGFRKFFNSAEGYAAKIDWDTAHVLEKLDGTFIQVYWDWVKEEWCAGTTGMAEAEGPVNNKQDTSFSELFWDTLYEKYGITRTSFNSNTNMIFVFELTTPYNIVVKPHGESSVTLLAIRFQDDLSEIHYDSVVEAGKAMGLPVVKSYDLNEPNIRKLLNTFKDMVWHEEGYVVVDDKFNRVKLKNPAYVAVHHLKDKTGAHNIMGVVKSNEIEEFAATFPERKGEIFNLKERYDELLSTLEVLWENIPKPKTIEPKERKKFASSVFELTKEKGLTPFTGMFFNLYDGKIDSVQDFLFEFDDKKLYNLLREK